jgi:TatD DNase family protein
MGWIDVHTHLNFLKDVGVDEALSAARGADVTQMITIGTEPNDHQLVLDIAREHFPEVGCTLGVHPHEARLYTDDVEKFIDQHLGEREVVAVGEIGLDYFYETSPRESQREAFRRQLKLAWKHRMPVEIHTRDAEADTAEILNEFRGQVSGILHCFTGTLEMARTALDLGLDISFSGVVTFKNADDLRAVARFVPVERIHVETDAPFLAPIPMRGKSNVPAYVVHTAHFVADLKGLSPEGLREATNANARRTFPKLIAP